MERERLTQLLDEPHAVTREDLAGLRALTERYPWFSAAQLLRTWGEHAAGEVLFDGTLQQAAAHIPDRSILFDAVHGSEAQRPVLRVVPTGRPAREEASDTDAAGRPPEVVDRIAEQPADVPPSTVQQTPPPPQQQAPNVDHAPPEGTIDDPLDREIRRAALASGYELVLEHAPERVVRTDGTPPTEMRPVSEVVEDLVHPDVEASEPPTTPSEPLVAKGPSDAIPVQAYSPGTKRRFIEWLGPQGMSVVRPPKTVDTPAVSTLPPSLPGPVQAPPAAKAPPTDTAALIDRFIKQSTPEPKSKAAFFTPQQAAKRSLDDTAGLVTETLARIHEKQGHLDKAIDAYRKLALKYPEKSAYFAALAKALEEQQKK